MEKKILIGLTFISLIIVGFVLFSIFFVTQPNIEEDEGETVYVSTVFGCLPLKDTYTEEEWEAKQEFMGKYSRGGYVRCD